MSKNQPQDQDPKEYFEIVDAIQKGSLKTVLDVKPDLVNKKLSSGMTVAHLAITLGTVEDIEYLAQKGADFNVLNDDKMTPLALAASSGELDKLNKLIENGAKLDLEGGRQSILVEAAFSGKDDIIDALLKNGAKMQVGNEIIDKNNPQAKIILKVVASIEEASNKKDLNAFYSKMKNELGNRLGGGEIAAKVLDGIGNVEKRNSILESIGQAKVSEEEKGSTKAALVFCWNEIDEAGKKFSAISKEPDQKKAKSQLYRIMAGIYRAVATAIKVVAKCFKQQTPQSAVVASAVAATCTNIADKTSPKIPVQVNSQHVVMQKGNIGPTRGR